MAENRLELSSHAHFKQGITSEFPYPDETFELVYNGRMFDLIPLDRFRPILMEFARVLKPAGIYEVGSAGLEPATLCSQGT